MIYRARFVLPMDGQTIQNGEVLVADGEIKAVGKCLSLAHPDEPTCDLGRCALLPGFVNAHSHIDPTFMRNFADGLNLWDWLDRLGFRQGCVPPLEIVELSALLGASESVLSGVTCVGDCSHTGLAAAALGKIGLRGIVYREMFGQSMGADYAQVFHRKLNEAQQAQSKASPLVRIGISPHAIYTSNCELLKLCAETCAQLNMPVALHLAETSAETDYSMHGVGPLADLRRRLGYEPMTSGLTPTRHLQETGLLRPGVCLAHCVHVTDDEIDLIASSGAGVAHCPRSNAYLGAGIAPLTRLLKSRCSEPAVQCEPVLHCHPEPGRRVGLGTDSAGSCMRLDFFEEMRFALGLHRAASEDATVLTAKSVLELATIGGARALGLADRIGTLVPGKRADIVAVDLSRMLPGEDVWLAIISRSPSDVRLVMVDGVELVRDGELVGFDIDACGSDLAARLESTGIG